MGANQSSGEELSHDKSWAGKDNSQNKGHNLSGSFHNHSMLEKPRKNKAKPNPPIKIKFLDVTHNAIVLSWHGSLGIEGHSIIAYTVEMATISPGKDSHWRTLTKCCQGTTYEARYLEPNTDYVFRVRSENIFGIGKPSRPSDICTTKMFETFSTDFRSPGVSHNSKCLDVPSQNATRHYSFNMHIGKGVKSILNHSEIDIESSTESSRSSPTLTSDRPKKPHVFYRSNINRTSLPSNRKISAPLLLPGTRTNSLNRLRDSRKCAKTDMLDNKHRTSTRDSGIGGLQESLTVFDSNSVDSQASEEDGDRKHHDFRSYRLPVHSHKLCANSIDGDSGKGSKNSLCDSMKISDNQSIMDSTDADLVIGVCDRTCVTVSSTCSNIDSCENINILGNIDENTDIYKSNALSNIDENTDICKTNTFCNIDENSIYKSSEDLKDVHYTNGKPNINKPGDKDIHLTDAVFTRDSQKRGYYETLDNPWQRDTSVGDVSEQILAAPVSDDLKMALYKKNLPRNQRFITDSGRSFTGLVKNRATDFRTLRSVLQSSNVIVKNSRSLPDVVAIVTVNGETKTVIQGTLTAILDNKEENDAVRITTL